MFSCSFPFTEITHWSARIELHTRKYWISDEPKMYLCFSVAVCPFVSKTQFLVSQSVYLYFFLFSLNHSDSFCHSQILCFFFSPSHYQVLFMPQSINSPLKDPVGPLLTVAHIVACYDSYRYTLSLWSALTKSITTTICCRQMCSFVRA